MKPSTDYAPRRTVRRRAKRRRGSLLFWLTALAALLFAAGAATGWVGASVYHQIAAKRLNA